MFQPTNMLRHIGLLPAIFLALLPCLPGKTPALASHVGSSGVDAENLVQIQICTTPGKLKYLVLNLATGEMFEATSEQSDSVQHHQKCGHSLCQGAGFSADLHELSDQFLVYRSQTPASILEVISIQSLPAVARAPPAIQLTSRWA